MAHEHTRLKPITNEEIHKSIFGPGFQGSGNAASASFLAGAESTETTTRTRPRIINEAHAPLSDTAVQTGEDPGLSGTSLKTLSVAGPVASGLTAGSQVTPTTDVESAVWQSIGSGLTGAAGGALAGAQIGAMGGPIGAVKGAAIGGLTGLVVGGINSYLGLKKAREQRREQREAIARIQKKQEKALRQQRADMHEQMRYNRRVNALQSRWDAMNTARKHMNNAITQNENLKQLFLKQAR